MRYPDDPQHLHASPLPQSENTVPHRVQADFGDSPTIPTHPPIPIMLDEIKEASRQGDRQRAYQLSLEVTRLAPESVEGWVYLAVLTEDRTQKIAYLNKALSLAPDYSYAQRGMYEALKYTLEQDPFLRYLEETDTLYHVLTGEGRVVNVPKERTPIAAYPPKEPPPLRPVFRWLAFSILGMLIGGLGTLVCAPVAMIQAWNVIQEPVNRTQRRSAAIAMIFAGVLWLVSFFLSFLFVLHVLAI